jgi:antirestriction protein ArdC
MKVKEIVTGKILKSLEDGDCNWKKTWITTPAQNYFTGHVYRGINFILIPPGRYATYNQLVQHGARPNKESSGFMVTYAKRMKSKRRQKDDEDKETFFTLYGTTPYSQLKKQASKSLNPHAQMQGSPTQKLSLRRTAKEKISRRSTTSQWQA